jgi:hypothetical protein
LRARRGLDELQAMQAFIAEAKSKEVAVLTDTTAVARRQIEMAQRLDEAERARRHLNDRLRLACGWQPQQPERIWPVADLTVTAETLDVEAAVAEGMAQRSDLLQLRQMLCRLDADTLPLARALLAQVDGIPSATTPGLRAWKSDRDLHLRREQLQHLLAERERAAVVEIADAVTGVELRRRQVWLSHQRVLTWRERTAELERQLAAGKASRLEVGQARLEALAAEGLLLHDVIAWKTALVKLAAAQGSLASESPAAPLPQ